MFAAQGNPLTGFSNADMDWLHAQVESAMCKLHKAEETECASPSPLEWKAVKAVKPAGDKKPPEESPEEEAGEKPAEEEEEEAEETEEAAKEPEVLEQKAKE